MKPTGRVLLLTTPSSYRLPAFLDAAERLGVEALVAEDTPRALAGRSGLRMGLDFGAVEAALATVRELAAEAPIAAVIAVDDSGGLLAARASAALGLPHNSLASAEAAHDKHLMRRLFAAAGVPSPVFRLCSTGDDLEALAAEVAYPCVVKPLRLNGSRGVIRADDPRAFVAAARRLARLLDRVEGRPGPKEFLVEGFIPGFEVALEGLIDRGRLQVLALFDKPDPLDGPFFEETIYVTPSRLPAATQEAIAAVAARAAAAVGLERGPLHAELRVNEGGPVMVELAGRSIGGLCSRTLQFGTDASLEELILRQAAGLPVESLGRAGSAGGVMMIPIPKPGVLRAVSGVEAARAVPLVESVEITAPLHYPLVPLPEGDAYLGFIFARGETPEAVEAALREGHARLSFELLPQIPLVG
ncbi:MAG TPA: ATP-grasp domain-containing protein [Chloroflexaceae bacterium]|nr:ATP-grasp domain-containing protein [Chloroflexaceae bacterium]